MEINQLNLTAVIEQVGKEKNIDKEVLVSALEAAMLSAARKKLGPHADLEARFNEEVGEVEVYEFKQIVEGETHSGNEISFADAMKLDAELSKDAIGEDLGIKLDSKEFGRIAAQNAKQIIIQRVREAERMMIYDEYKDRKDELVTGTIRRFERGAIIVDLGRAEAVIPTREQINKENVRIGDRIVAYVFDVLEISRGAQIVLSRTHPNLVVRLFEQEVPEIADGIVTIEGAAREAGFRTKIAVLSKDSDVDPVGACVGMKGSRVQAVVQELRGEKIDIVPFDRDEARFVCNALAPAEVTRVLVNETEHSMQIVVPDDQLSLAIGRRGQNVRLAAELTGWKIDINSETKVAEEREQVGVSLSRIEGLTEFQIQTLYNHGFRSLKDVSNANESLLSGLPGIDAELAAKLKTGAVKLTAADEKSKGNKEHHGKVHDNMLIYDDLMAKLEGANQEDAVSLKSLEITEEESQLLSDNSYLDIGDIYFEELENLVKTTGLSLERAQIIHDKAKVILADLSEGNLK
ncbi:MAG: transcription termination factor NusA [bacterium]|nr:transcription termination factor NusA [bacterium]